MIPKIIEIRGNEVQINIDVLCLSPLNKIHEKHKKDGLNMLKVLYYYFPSEDNPNKAFANTPESERLKKIIEHFQLPHSILTNVDFANAFDFLKDQYFDTIDRAQLAAKKNLENLSTWAVTPVTDGQGGNVTQKMQFAKQLTEYYIDYLKFEEIVKKSKTKSRGDKKVATDATKDYE